MKLGELIQKYMEEHELSYREFAEKCNVSHNYINVLINGNKKTGKPVTPTLKSYQKLADGMNISLDDLFSKIDDVPVVMNDVKLSDLDPEKVKMITFFESLTEENKANAMQYLEFLKGQQK